ncbi:aspartate dehydrogenase [Falsiroseomonas oryzae]|uniref:aspartate dehydrogenase n=1 Tax=Falsiroseomonas oryzae TaxID=2766473 RepID=UPI0022EAE71C|nr:aspartate dehydrogenase [Roseomonas sp. MO-31]
MALGLSVGEVPRIALLGFGRIGRRIAGFRPDLVAVLVRPAQSEAARVLLPHAVVATELDAVLAARPDVVVEAAGVALLREAGEAVLRAGADLIPLSLTAFAEDAMLAGLQAAAAAAGTRLVVPPGAIGSLDALGAAKEAGLAAVTYRSVKPPRVFRGTIVAQRLDLGALAVPTVVFDGTAREAARDFPRTCNVTVGIALAGLGLDRTRVELVADPAAERTTHEVAFACDAASGRIEMTGRLLPPDGDPADMTAFSVLRLLRRWRHPVFV